MYFNICTSLIASTDLWPQEMFNFLEMLAIIVSETVKEVSVPSFAVGGLRGSTAISGSCCLHACKHTHWFVAALVSLVMRHSCHSFWHIFVHFDTVLAFQNKTQQCRHNFDFSLCEWVFHDLLHVLIRWLVKKNLPQSSQQHRVAFGGLLKFLTAESSSFFFSLYMCNRNILDLRPLLEKEVSASKLIQKSFSSTSDFCLEKESFHLLKTN